MALPSRIRTSQPIDANVGINWANPLTWGLAHVALPLRADGLLYDFVTQKWFTPSGGGSLGLTPGGRALKTASASSQYQSLPSNVTGQPLTLLVVHTVDSSTSEAHVSLGTASGSGRAVLFYGNGGAQYLVSTVNTSGGVGTNTSIAASSGVQNVAGIITDATPNNWCFVNGVLSPVTAAASLPSGSMPFLYVSGRMNNTIGSFADQRCNLVLVWNRALSDAEIAQACAAPYQVLDDEVVNLLKAASGTTFNDSLTESIAASDSCGAAAMFDNALSSGAVTMGDSSASAAVFSSQLSESVAPSDSDGSVQIFVASLSESTSLLDDYTGSIAGGPTTYNESLAESLAMADALIALQVMPNALAESVAPGDSESAAAVFASQYTETITMNDGFTTTVILANTLAEAIAVADALGATMIMVSTLGESVTLTATVAGTISGTAVWPDPSTVAIGVQYGPTGIEYTGTATKGGMVMRRR